MTLTRTPPPTAKIQIDAATRAATFQFVDRVIVSSEGRFTDGPAMSNATAAPTGAPDPSNIRASGISKKVGSASGTAKAATTTIARNLSAFELYVPAGTNCAITIESSTPIIITGTNRAATRAQARKK